MRISVSLYSRRKPDMAEWRQTVRSPSQRSAAGGESSLPTPPPKSSTGPCDPIVWCGRLPRDVYPRSGSSNDRVSVHASGPVLEPVATPLHARHDENLYRPVLSSTSSVMIVSLSGKAVWKEDRVVIRQLEDKLGDYITLGMLPRLYCQPSKTGAHPAGRDGAGHLGAEAIERLREMVGVG